MDKQRLLFSRASGFIIAYTIIVILWGAFVRISHSGDGCGEHWPLCQGSLIPQGEVALLMQTWVEFFHRIKSGLLGILILGQTIWCFRLFPKDHPSRTASSFVLFLTFTEALLGAVLVLGKFVGDDASVGRLVVMSAHLMNTLLLLAAMTALWRLARLSRPVRQVVDSSNRHWLIVIASAIAVLASTGVWAALASTLFPSESLKSGLLSDFAPDSHIFLRLRILHPLGAIALSAIVLLGISKLSQVRPRETAHFRNGFYSVLIVGALTLFLLSPTPLRIAHLFVVDLMWISFVSLVVSVYYRD